ncbi:MAG: hypothetical protein ABSE63_10880 [Thermoguttaceae bacterium]|jgi:uncharacterized protein YacL
MFDNDWREQLPVKIRVTQIIVGALSFGCFCFLLIAIFVSQSLNKAPDQLILTYIALPIAAIILCVWAVLPFIIVSQGRKNIQQKLFSNAKQASDSFTDDKKENENTRAQMILNLLQTKIIVASAILEGAVFFLLIAYMAERSMLCLAAALVLLFLLIAQMPTSGRATYWVEDQLKSLDV